MVCLKWWGFVDPLTIYASWSRLKERFLGFINFFSSLFSRLCTCSNNLTIEISIKSNLFRNTLIQADLGAQFRLSVLVVISSIESVPTTVSLQTAVKRCQAVKGVVKINNFYNLIKLFYCEKRCDFRSLNPSIYCN